MDSPDQDYLVYLRGNTAVVRGQISGTEVFVSEDAAEVIQYAIARLGSIGGQVTLARGVYALSRPIQLANNVCLHGSGRGTRLIVAGDTPESCGIYGSGVYGASVTNLSVQSPEVGRAGSGIVLDACGDSRVIDVFCAGFESYGIWVRNNSYLCQIRGCVLAGNRTANLYLDRLNRGKYGNFIPNLVTNCTIYAGGTGIECNASIVVNIVACVVYQTRGYAYHIHSGSNSVLITGSRSFQITGEAVRVENAHEFNVSSNIFCWHTGHGIVVNNAYWGVISGNEVIDSGSYNPGGPDTRTRFSELSGDVPLFDGIHLTDTRGYQVSGNTIFNWSVAPRMNYGIYEDEHCFKNTIVNNTVNYYMASPVHSAGESSLEQTNTGHYEFPYNDAVLNAETMTVQSFEPELIEQFLALQFQDLHNPPRT